MNAESPLNIDDLDPQRRELLKRIAAAGSAWAWGSAVSLPVLPSDDQLREAIRTVVVIYAENRSFNNLFPDFPGLESPLASLQTADVMQVDRDGETPLKTLPPIWGGMVPRGQTFLGKRYHIEERALYGLPNLPYDIAGPDGAPLPLNIVTRDLTHRFYGNQMQIAAGRCNQFVAWGNSGALVMGHYRQAGAELKLRRIAARYTLCDNFFMAAYGGSFLNHIFLIAAAPPHYPDARASPARGNISVLEGEDPAGSRLKIAASSPKSCMDGPPVYANDSMLTPDGFAVNSAAPPYQPSYVKAAPGEDPRYADPRDANVLPAQIGVTIGDRLTDKGVTWAWYGGGWQAALDNNGNRGFPAAPLFQAHHQPFNYYARFAPGTAAREEHLRDGGTGNTPTSNRFLADADAGRLPSVVFYKPQGNLNLHAGYADVATGDQHLATVIDHLERSPQWDHMLVIVTFDENGGWWDHVSPPLGDRWGPGNRVPAIIISPYAKRGFVDHTAYDTNSILRFITRLHRLSPLPGVASRDAVMTSRGQQKLGDLTNSLLID